MTGHTSLGNARVPTAAQPRRRTQPARVTLTEVVLLVLIFAILVPAISCGNIAASLERARQVQCAANLRSIGQSIKVYSSGNRGRWPTVYGGREGEAWGQKWTEDDTSIDDWQENVKPEDLDPFTCNVSCWWMLIRQGLSMPGVFICPSSGHEEDGGLHDVETVWSFRDLSNCSYSYQNQLGKGTTDSADADLIVAADASPLRADMMSASPPRGSARWELNSPVHEFEGQNCLYADGHVTFEQTPEIGIDGNNIWLRSTLDQDTGKWTEDAGSYSDPTSQIGDPKDSFLVP